MTFDLSVQEILSLAERGKLARQVLRTLFPDIVPKEIHRVDREDIFSYNLVKDVVCDYFQVDNEYVHKRVRRPRVVYIRSILFYLSYMYTTRSVIDIASDFKMNHTSILNGRNLVMDQLSLRNKNQYSVHVDQILLLLNETNK